LAMNGAEKKTGRSQRSVVRKERDLHED
jgi:hypothetical protein